MHDNNGLDATVCSLSLPPSYPLRSVITNAAAMSVIFVESLRLFELKITMEIEMLMYFPLYPRAFVWLTDWLWEIFKWESPTLQFVTKCVRHIDIWIYANFFAAASFRYTLHTVLTVHTSKTNDKKENTNAHANYTA